MGHLYHLLHCLKELYERGMREQGNADFLVVGVNQFTVVVLFVVVVSICFVDIQYSEAESSRSM